MRVAWQLIVLLSTPGASAGAAPGDAPGALEPCADALLALARRAEFVRNKVRDADGGCYAVRATSARCDWDDPEANRTRNGNCLVCAQLAAQRDAWQASLRDALARVDERCRGPIDEALDATR